MAHGGLGGVPNKICNISSKIIRVKLQVISWFGGFVPGVEFITENGRSCKIGKISRVTQDLHHPGYYLAHLSGGLDTWTWTGGSTQCINGLSFHWRQMIENPSLIDGPFPMKELSSLWSDQSLAPQGQISEIGGRGGHAIDQLRIKYGSSWSPTHGGAGGVPVDSCKINGPIVRVRLQVISWFGGFITGVEFTSESGQSCNIGRITRITHTLQHPGYYLSFLSGGLDTWRWTGGSAQCINGLSFHWKQGGGGTQPTVGITSATVGTTPSPVGSKFEKIDISRLLH